jgi:hypothetical protein
MKMAEVTSIILQRRVQTLIGVAAIESLSISITALAGAGGDGGGVSAFPALGTSTFCGGGLSLSLPSTFSAVLLSSLVAFGGGFASPKIVSEAVFVSFGGGFVSPEIVSEAEANSLFGVVLILFGNCCLQTEKKQNMRKSEKLEAMGNEFG